MPGVHVASGPTCAGKSTLIRRLGANGREIILGAPSAAERLHEGSDAIVHYNILYPYEQRDALRRGTLRKKVALYKLLGAQKRWGVYGDCWRHIPSRYAGGIHVSVLVTAREELLQRVAVRRVVDPLRDPRPLFRKQCWRRIYGKVDLHGAYRLWLEYLRKRGIPFEVLWSTAGEFKPVPAERIPEVLDGAAAHAADTRRATSVQHDHGRERGGPPPP